MPNRVADIPQFFVGVVSAASVAVGGAFVSTVLSLGNTPYSKFLAQVYNNDGAVLTTASCAMQFSVDGETFSTFADTANPTPNSVFGIAAVDKPSRAIRFTGTSGGAPISFRVLGLL